MREAPVPRSISSMQMSSTSRGRRLTLAVAVVLGLLWAAGISGASGQGSGSARSPFTEVVAALVRPAAVGSVEIAKAPRLPACRIKDKPTRYGKVREWSMTLLDTNLRLDRSYEPWDLVNVSRAGISGVGKVRRIMIDDLREMAAAARKAGKPLGVRSAYRSFATQKAIFAREARRVGRAKALKFVARPGHSEHQLGTTIDFMAAGGSPLDASFGTSPAGRWIAKHGWKHGFVLSYPKGKKRVTCYGYEPWHWRYVGRDRAREIHEAEQAPRRFLWQRFESGP